MVPRNSAAVLVVIGVCLVGAAGTQKSSESPKDVISPVVQQLLSLDNRDAAMRQIINDQKYNNDAPGTYTEKSAARVKHVVVCPQAAGPPVFAVFLMTNYSAEMHQPKGHIILVDSSGAMIRFYHAANSMSKRSIIADVNGDGLVEAVESFYMTDVEFLFIMPLTPKQTPILRIAYEDKELRGKRGGGNSRWTWKVEHKGEKCAVRLGLEDLTTEEFTEKAVFQWSAEKKAFVGPDGGPREGFIRLKDSTGLDDEWKVIERFVAGKEQ